MTLAAMVIAVAAAGLFLVRLVIGPSLPDRIIALDGMLGSVAVAIVIGVVRSGSSAALETVLVITLVAFVGTAVAARYVERRGG